MDHQKCRICGDRHPLGSCPKFAGKPFAKAINKTERDNLAIIKPTEIKQVEKKTSEKKAKYDRNESHKTYMKKYMQKVRATKPDKKAKA